ncbi:MAG TPA: CBS domain-containing protein [Phycisphaerales bacterium]|nr:CBS domain-containing protein [Phycisphaerales bacterium]
MASLRVDLVMTQELVTVGPDDTLADVREIFDTHCFHHLLVVEHRKVIGVISDRDLLKHLSPFVGKLSERAQDAFTLQRKAHQVMSRNVVSIGADTDLSQATRLMLDHGVSCLPVIDERQHPIGLVTWRDLLKAVAHCGLDPLCRLPNSAA